MKMRWVDEEWRWFWDYVAERHKIWAARAAGEPWPWTKDPILQSYHFTNVYRELDPGTTWLSDWLERHSGASMEARLLNIAAYRIGLHERSAEAVGWVPFGPQSGAFLSEQIARAQAGGMKPYSSAYMVPQMGRSDPKHVIMGEIIQGLVEAMRERGPLLGDTWWEARAGLRSVWGIGDFGSLQILFDANYPWNGLMPWGNDEAITAGPGAKAGLRYLLARPTPTSATVQQAAITALQERHEEELERRDMPWWGLGERADGLLSLANIQNCLCEYSKLRRVRAGKTGPRVRYFEPNPQENQDHDA